MKTTPKGRMTIFHAPEFFEGIGQPIPSDFNSDRSWVDGPWFYMPSDWTAETGWNHRLGTHRPYPFAYSKGYATEDEALTDAISREDHLMEVESIHAAADIAENAGADNDTVLSILGIYAGNHWR